jgi:two-component system sensor kinase FixL
VDFSILESVPDAMVIADEAGAIRYVNATAERLFGYSRDELLGKPVELLLPARFRAAHRVHRSGYQAAPRTRPMGLGLDLTGLRRDGGEFPAEISLSQLDLDGRSGVIAAVRDVSERKEIEERARQLRKAREEIQERDEFLSIASHELRTPVTALQLQLQLLQRAAQRSIQELPRVLEGKMDVLERQTRRIALLVGELLDVSRIRLGSLELRLEEVDLAEIARDAADQVADELRRSGSSLVVDLRPAIGRWDRLRIEQVVMNLLLNAASFGEGRPISLRVDGEGARARVRVTDAGIGISPDPHRRVLERLEPAVPPEHFGGLGLYVARKIVEAHGGTIELTSVPDEGATFTVELPREPPAAEREAPRAELH